MVRPQPIAVSYDPEIDAPQRVKRESALAAAVFHTVTWIASGVWIGGELVTSYVVYPVARYALSPIMMMDHHNRSTGPIAGFIYSRVAMWTDALACVCAAILVFGSLLELIRNRDRLGWRISIAALFVGAFAMLVINSNIQMNVVTGAYSAMAAILQTNQWEMLSQSACVTVAVFMQQWMRFSSNVAANEDKA